MQKLEDAIREAQRLTAPETVVFIPPKPAWQPFQQPEAPPLPCVQWQPSRRPEYRWAGTDERTAP